MPVMICLPRCLLPGLLLALLSTPLNAQTKEGSWKCRDDGFWYNDGVKTEHHCNDKSRKEKHAEACTNSENPSMPQEYAKTCITAPPDSSERCWWTYTPRTVAGSSKMPLVIDMHGGGGCASDQAVSSGWKELSDVKSFVVVWPQGDQNMWGTCGSNCEAVSEAEKGEKEIHSTDDVTFLTDLIAHAVKTDGSNIDPERIYATGFSMGCMMSHRLALEKSNILAGFGCHGGRMIGLSSDVQSDRLKYDVKRMGVYMTGGDNDDWFTNNDDLNSWSVLNDCTSNPKSSTALKLQDNDIDGAKQSAKESSSGGFDNATVTVVDDCGIGRLSIEDGNHVPDSRMATFTYTFLMEKEGRKGALDAINAIGSASQNTGGFLGISMVVLLAISLLLLMLHV